MRGIVTQDVLAPLSRAEIEQAAVPLKEATTCGVYFLLREGEIVYVGQSVSCEARIQVHSWQGEKLFDSYTIQPLEAHRLDYVESFYVLNLQPEYNMTLNPSHLGLVRVGSEATKELASTRTIKRWISEGRLKPRSFRQILYVYRAQLREVAGEA